MYSKEYITFGQLCCALHTVIGVATFDYDGDDVCFRLVL